MNKLLFKVGITDFNIQRIRYIRNILELGNRRLVGPAVIAKSQVFALRRCVIEIGSGEEIRVARVRRDQ